MHCACSLHPGRTWVPPEQISLVLKDVLVSLNGYQGIPPPPPPAVLATASCPKEYLNESKVAQGPCDGKGMKSAGLGD